MVKARFVYVGIRVKDLEESINFYTRLLGMRVVNKARYDQTGGEIVNLESEDSGFVLELNYYMKDSPYDTEYSVGEGLDHLAFKVDDLDKALKEAESAGHKTILQIGLGRGRWAYIKDPNGIWIELY